MSIPTEVSTVETMPKVLDWRHGFMFALPVAAGLFVTVGFMVGAIGAIPAIAICVVLSVIAVLQNRIWAEMAAMFPTRSGGLAAYIAEGWKQYARPVAAFAGFGYWCGWALAVSIVGVTIGFLVQAAWFPEATWVAFSLFGVDFGLPQTIAAIAIVICTLANLLGVRVAARFNLVIGVALLIAIAMVAVLPFFSGTWSADSFSWRLGDDWRVPMVWMYVMAWTIYGTELSAVFAPEYKDTSRDTSKALTLVALFCVGAYTIVPIATTGQIGEQEVANNPIAYGAIALAQISPVLGTLFTIVLCGALFMMLISASADASRSLFALSRDRLSIRQFGKLNGRGVPGSALWATMLVNLAIVALIGNPVAILIAANFGYILAVVVALIAFLLLRRDQPETVRPIKLGRPWITVAIVLAGFNASILIVGVSNPELAAGAGLRDVAIGIGLVLTGVILYLVRRFVQDRG